MTPTRRISPGDLFRVFLRLLFMQGTIHNRGMQSLAVARAMGPALGRLDTGEHKELVLRHLKYFNCNPNFVPLILGGVLRLEEDRAAGRAVRVEDVAYFKRAVSSPLAAMGDMLFLAGLKPLSLTLACIFAIYNCSIGLLAVLLLYNAVVLSCRLWGVYFGYAKGWELVDVFTGPFFQRLLGIVQSVGAGVGGALVAIVLYRLPQGGTWVVVPGLVLAGLAFVLLRKGRSTSRMAILLYPLSVIVAILM